MPGIGKRWFVLGALLFAELLVFIDNTIVNVALPSLARELETSDSGLQWTVDMYTLVFAGLLLTGGYLGDRYGRKLVLVIGIVGFTGMSVLGGMSGSAAQLIAVRGGLGVFAALVFPATLAITVVVFEDLKERALAVAAWAAVAGVAAALGPVVGGWLLSRYSWESIFWINVPAGLLALVAVLILVPRNRSAEIGKFDLRGMVLSIVGVALVVYSMIEAPAHGWLSLRTLGGLAAGLLIIGAFVAWERRTPDALFEVRLFADRDFAVAATLLAAGMFSLMGFVFLITQYFQGIKGYSPFEAGLRQLPFAVAMMLAAGPAMWLASRIGAGRAAVGGILVAVAGFWLTVRYDGLTDYWTVIAPVMVVLGVGVAVVSGPATFLVLNQLSDNQVGAGSAVNDTSREVGGTFGVAVLGSILASVYGGRITEGLSGLPVPTAVEEAASRSMLSGMEVAEMLPEPYGDDLRELVAGAFLDGFHLASAAAGGVALLAAIGCWFVLRQPDAGAPESTIAGRVAETAGPSPSRG